MRPLDEQLKKIGISLAGILRSNPWVLWSIASCVVSVPLLGVAAIYYHDHIIENLSKRGAHQNRALSALDHIEKNAYRMTLEAYSLSTLQPEPGDAAHNQSTLNARMAEQHELEQSWLEIEQSLRDYEQLAESAERQELAGALFQAAYSLRRAAIDLAAFDADPVRLRLKKRAAERAERRFAAEANRVSSAEWAALGRIMDAGERAISRAKTVLSLAWVVAATLACAVGFLLSKQQRDAALEAGRLKSRFLANMSHEIRTPMNIVIGMTELVLDSSLQPAQRRHLSMVKSSAESLLSVINNVLDFSKIEAGRLELEAAEFSVADTLADSTRALAVRARQKGLQLICYVHPGVPQTLVGDALRLKQIIVNLVGNAIRFTEKGVIRVRARLQEETSDRVVVHFAVSDTGVGIPLDKQRLIFDSFSQVDSSVSRRHGGTGLGLAISLQLVKLMQGDLGVRSQPGQGSTFSFTACFQRVRPAESAAQASEFDGVRALVVDRDSSSRHALAAMLKTWGMEAAVADSSDTAREVLKLSSKLGREFAVVLVNLETVQDSLANSSGDPLLESTPLILVADQEPDSNWPSRTKADCLVKPVSASHCLEAIQAVFQRTLDRRPVPDGPPVTSPAATAADQAGGLHVLLVEDILENQLLMKEILHLRNYSVVIASNGKRALEAFDKERFDLILMDIQMPEMGGVEATSRIRQREAATGAHTPIIAVTAHAIKGDRERYLGAGMDGYVPKPLRRQELFDQIDALITPQAGVRA